MTVEQLDDFLERKAAAREEQEARRSRDVVTLLHAREDLRGVHALADFVGDRVLWTA